MATHPESMYRWRQMTEAARSQLLAERQKHRLPWHSPPHYRSDSAHYLITAACYEHRPLIGVSAERMSEFERSLVAACGSACESVFAWAVLPNHYHVLVKTMDVKSSLRSLGQLHGRTSFTWNGEEGTRGRQVWFNAVETGMKSERHFWASLLYVLHNAVRHGYVERWQDWPYCNASQSLEEVGRERAMQLWKEYPLGTYGDTWDPPEL